MNYTPIYLDRLADALAEDGIKLKRSRLLNIAAAAFGCRNVHELSYQDKKGELDALAPVNMGSTYVTHIGEMQFFRDPSGYIYAIEADKITGKGWHLAPLGGLASHVTAEKSTVGTESSNERCDPETPYFLTDSECHHVYGRQKDFAALGRELGTFENDFYPLDDKEAAYIFDGSIPSDDLKNEAHIGYSVMFRGVKHLCPIIEFPYGEENGVAYGHALEEAQTCAAVLRPRFERIGGHVLVQNDDFDRYGDPAVLILILVPFSIAMAMGTAEDWKDHLAHLLDERSSSVGEIVNHPEVRIEGRKYAVTLEFIGEGHDGDYDPTDPEDEPLYRFNVEILQNEKWIDVDDASYCTQIRADVGIEKARLAATYLLNQLDLHGGASIKRLCEKLSWTSIQDIEN